MTEEQYVTDMDGELELEIKKVAAIESADYTISADAINELETNAEIKHIFATLDR